MILKIFSSRQFRFFLFGLFLLLTYVLLLPWIIGSALFLRHFMQDKFDWVMLGISILGLAAAIYCFFRSLRFLKQYIMFPFPEED